MLNGGPLSLTDVEDVARQNRRVQLGDEARQNVETARKAIEAVATGGEAIYGINTGFGSLSCQRIKPEGIREVQRNLLRSHAAGVGDSLPREVVRAMLLILAASLARAKSGVRPIVIERICDLLNHDITPMVPSRGSVGASGDLAPLAHAALVLIGEGRAVVRGKEISGGNALK